MEIEYISVDSLTPYINNPRKNDQAVDKVAASIAEFGFKVPIVIDKTNVIVTGHTRYKAAQKLNMQQVPCILADDLTDAQIKAFRLADNRVAEEAEWDMDRLQIELEGLKELDFDLSNIGFDMSELEEIMGQDVSTEVIEDEPPELPEDPEAKRGEIWQLGKHRLMCGDSTSPEDIQQLMNGEKARFVFTDPPWNVDYGASKNPRWKLRTIANDNMSTEDFGAFLFAAFKAMKEVSEPGCMTYIVMSAQEWGNLMNALQELEYHWSSTIIWRKDSLVLSRKDYHTQYEPIWYGWTKGTRLCPLEDRTQSDVWDIPRPKVSEEHPTMKPVALVAKALENSSRAGDIVLDPFGGSGTTLIAAEQTDRACYMMELDPKYCDVIIQRWENLTGEKAVLI